MDLAPIKLIGIMLAEKEGLISEDTAKELLKKESPCKGQ